MNDAAVRGVPWTMLTFGTTKVLGVLTTIALSRLLAPSDFGLFALTTLGTGLLSIFNGNWLGAALIVRADLDDRARGTVITLLIASGVLIAAALAGLAPLAADIFHQPRLEPMLFLVSAILVFSGVNWFYEMVMQRELAFRRRFACQMARAVTFSTVALALALGGAGVWSLVIAHVAGHVANGIALITLAPYRVWPAFGWSRARDIVRNSRGFLGQELAEFFEQNADYISVGQVLGAAPLGFYSMAYRQAELPHLAVADPVGTVTFPLFARMRHAGEDLTRPFLTALRLVALLTFPMAVMLSAAAVPFTAAIFGPKWLPMSGVLAVLGIWAVARPLQVTIGRLLNSLGAAWLYGRVSVVGLVPFTLATVVGAKLGGIDAVAWVLLAYMTIIAVILMRIVGRHASIPVRSQWRVLRPLLLSAALSWAATRATADALAGVDPIVALAAALVACLASYAACVRLSDPEVVTIALRLVRRARPRRRTAVTAS